MNKMTKRRGISAVIATILLIVVSFVAISIIVGIIMPIVKNSLEKGKSCFELRDYFKINKEAGNFTCYEKSFTKLMIERGMEDFAVKGFIVSIEGDGASKRYDIYDNVTGIEMWNGSKFVSNIKIPEPGEARTYRFPTGNGKRVEIAVLQTNGVVCNDESYNIPSCPLSPMI